MNLQGAAQSDEKMKPVVSVAPWAASGVVLLGIGFILTSIGQMGALADHSHLWYLIFLGTSLFGIVVGAGLFSRREFFRKGGVLLAGLSIVGAFGKHSHEGFVQYMHSLSEQMAASGAPFSPDSVLQFIHAWNISWVTESTLAWGCIAFLVILDILIALAVIFFLTRPSVKALFR